MFTVYIEYEDRIEAKKSFRDPLRAQDYFDRFCRMRTQEKAAVVGLSGRTWKKYYRIDAAWSGDRTALDKGWLDDSLTDEQITAFLVQRQGAAARRRDPPR